MTTTTAPARPAADPAEQTLTEELAVVRIAHPGWALWLTEQGIVWMEEAVSGITLRAPTPKDAHREIAEWEHEADLRCQLPVVTA